MLKQIFLKIYIAIVFASFTCFPILSLESNLNLLTIWICSAVIWYLIAGLFLKYGGNVTGFIRERTEKLDSFMDRRLKGVLLFFFCWIVLILLWIRPYLALYPGVFGYDAPLQLCYWQGSVPMSTHHPVAHTVLLGLLYDLGCSLFKSENGGIALYTAVQGVIVTGAVACAIAYIRRRGAGAFYVLLALLWTGFNPFLQTLSFNCTKDILFGAFLLLFVIALHNYVYAETPGKGAVFCLAASGLLMCLFRNQGVYILAILLLFVLFASAQKTGLKQGPLLLILLCVIAATEGFGLFCTHVLHFEAGDSKEMFSIPIQQMAYVCDKKLKGEDADVTDEQLNTVESFIPESGIKAFDPLTADPVKSEFNTEAFTADFSNNLKTYIELGIQNPGDYLLIFRIMNSGYLKAKYFYFRPMMYMNTLSFLGPFEIHSDSADTDYYDLLDYYTSDLGYEDIPLMSVLYNPGLVTWLIAVLVGLSFYRRDYKLWLAALPMLLFLISLFLGPVALVRYIYPLILLVPFTGFLMIHPVSET